MSFGTHHVHVKTRDPKQTMQFYVDNLGATRIVDARDNRFDAIGLTRHPRREDVAVVSAADGCEGTCSLDACGLEGLPIEAHSRDRLPGEVAPEFAESSGILIDDGDRMAQVVQAVSEERADTAAAQDDDVHARTLHAPEP